MRNRAVDIALVVGLVLVAGAIVWTLFSLGRSPAPPPPQTSGPAAEAPEGDEEDLGVVPVEPGGAGADGVSAGPQGAGNEPAAGEEPAGAGPAPDGEGGAGDPAPNEDGAGADGPDVEADGEAAQDAGAGVGSTVADRPDPEIPADQAPPLPDEGPVELGRIGFSYVTGGAGACGIELEAWNHVAVSRELLEEFGCGAEVTVTLDDETAGRTEFDAVIADTMNPARSRTVNVYVGEDEPALEFGLTSGTLTVQE